MLIFDDGSSPQPKAMPKQLAHQFDRRIAMDTAMEMAEHRDERGGQPSSASEPPCLELRISLQRPIGRLLQHHARAKGTNSFGRLQVGLLMQGIGPENLVVHQCR